MLLLRFVQLLEEEQCLKIDETCNGSGNQILHIPIRHSVWIGLMLISFIADGDDLKYFGFVSVSSWVLTLLGGVLVDSIFIKKVLNIFKLKKAIYLNVNKCKYIIFSAKTDKMGIIDIIVVCFSIYVLLIKYGLLFFHFGSETVSGLNISSLGQFRVEVCRIDDVFSGSGRFFVWI